jgi:hypothetical protein
MSAIFKMAAKTRYKKWAVKMKFFNVGNQFGTSLSTHISNFDDMGKCWIFVVLWWPFWKWWPVEIFQWRQLIWDIIIYPHIKFWWYRTMLNFFRGAILHFQNFWDVCHFQNGCQNTVYKMGGKNSTLPEFIKIWYVGR